MGLQFGLEGNGQFCKRANRWLFEIPKVSADSSPGANALPPLKSARPNLSFKEMDVNHLIEDVFYPAKPDWKPINITLYDLQRNKHPVFDWIKEIYDVKNGKFYEPNKKKFIKECFLRMYDGCGKLVESWIYEDAWPQSINFSNLDMSDGGLVMCDINLRYARAYIEENDSN